MSLRTPTRPGITLAETVVATLLIAMVMVSTLQIVGPIARSTTVHADRLIAADLASEMIEEIATKPFVDPNTASIDDIGFDKDDVFTKRSEYDDIDDYNAWNSSPPMLSNGLTNYKLGSWTRSVKVSHVLLSDATTESVTSTGLKRVTVTVSKNGTVLCTLQSLHSQAADSVGYLVSN